jgi:hypothetical protein
MLKPDYKEPFEDEELEDRAQALFDIARDEGSLLSDERLMSECRQLAHEARLQQQALGDEPVALEEDE